MFGSNVIYQVYAPIDGTITAANFVNDSVGWEINVKTPYELDGQVAYYDLVHTSGLANDVKIGTFLRKGEQIAFMSRPYSHPREYILDFAIRRGAHKQANPNSSNWTGTEYVSVLQFVLDDLTGLSAGSFQLVPTCQLTSKNNVIPEAKRTPRP